MAHIQLSTMIRQPPASAVNTFRSDPSVWLPLPHRRVAARRWQLHMWAGAVAIPVEATIGETRREDRAHRRLVRIKPRGSSRLGSYAPEIFGDIVVSSADDGLVVGLDVHYRPPFGLMGHIGDRLGMRVVVVRACERLLQDIVAGLGLKSVRAERRQVAAQGKPVLVGATS